MEAFALTSLWVSWLEKGDQQARKGLIEHYLPYARHTAIRATIRLSGDKDRDDYISAATIGLIKAVDTFDPKNGAQFITYAISLMRGAVLEMMRKDDWMPRSLRDKMRQIKQVGAKLNQQGIPTTEENMAKALNMSLDEFALLLQEVAPRQIFSLGIIKTGAELGAEGLHLEDMLEDLTLVGAQDTVEKKEQNTVLCKNLGYLPDRERRILQKYFWENRTMKEIGQEFSISESRIHQIFHQASKRLYGYMQHEQELFR